MIYIIPIIVTVAFLILMLIFSSIDYNKKRKITKKPFISFIVPCYNDKNTIKNTIKSIYDSYDKRFFELFVINDNSSDDSLEQINEAKKTNNFTIINNHINLGKARSINSISTKTKGEIIFIVDADTIITKKAVNEIISRFEYNPNLGATSCPPRPKREGFFPLMQSIEYNILNLVTYSHNIYSGIFLWGCCLAVKKDVFDSVKGFSENKFSEDFDLALKIQKLGLKIEQCSVSVETNVPTNLRSWWKQKMRWNSGAVQCYLSYPKTILNNPITIFLLSVYSIIVYYALINNFIIGNFYFSLFQIFFNLIKFTGIHFIGPIISTAKDYKKELFTILIYQTSFLVLNIPYSFTLVKKLKDIKNILLVIPFCLIYYPLFYFAWIIGSIKGIKDFIVLKNRIRAW